MGRRKRSEEQRIDRAVVGGYEKLVNTRAMIKPLLNKSRTKRALLRHTHMHLIGMKRKLDLLKLIFPTDIGEAGGSPILLRLLQCLAPQSTI